MNIDDDVKEDEKKPCWICLDKGATQWGGPRIKKCRCGTEWISIGGKEIMKHDKQAILDRTRKMLDIGPVEGTIQQHIMSIGAFLSNSDPYGNPEILIEESSTKAQFVFKTKFHGIDILIILDYVEPYYFHHFFEPQEDYYKVQWVCEDIEIGDV